MENYGVEVHDQNRSGRHEPFSAALSHDFANVSPARIFPVYPITTVIRPHAVNVIVRRASLPNSCPFEVL